MKIINLTQALGGKEYLIYKVNISDVAKHKWLCELGFCEGLKLVVVKKTRNLLIVGALGCCFSIDNTLAEQIFVYGE